MAGKHHGVALVTVVSGDAYYRYADELYESAREHFMAGMEWKFLVIPGREGWPDATMYRYHEVRNQWDTAGLATFTHIFLCDADMRFEGPVGPEILGGYGISATLHPGYIGKPIEELPYERRKDSMSMVRMDEGDLYYCGGFVGGRGKAFKQLCNRVKYRIDLDDSKSITPEWHDESALNYVLWRNPPELVLSPAYCHPDNDAYYRTIWPEDYPRLLVALDKTQAERGDR